MSEISFAAPPKGIAVRFALEPAYNALSSLALLNSEFSIPNEWIKEMTAHLTPELRQTNERVSNFSIMQLSGETWPTLSTFLDDMEKRDPVAIRDKELNIVLQKATRLLGDNSPMPTKEQLVADRATFFDFFQRFYQAAGEPCCSEEYLEKEFEMFQNPAEKKAEALVYLRTMWRDHLAAEWEKNLPVLRDSIAAFESLDYTGKSLDEIFKLVTDRDLPPVWEHLREEAEQIIFIPSAHVAPYLMLIGFRNGTARLVFGARIPAGAAARSPALSRSELLTRLSALADDTRLRILELLAQEGEQSAATIIERLGLSQSGASRHLSQLSATNFLIERREGAKQYRVNTTRIEDTFNALKNFLLARI